MEQKIKIIEELHAMSTTEHPPDFANNVWLGCKGSQPQCKTQDQ